MDEGFINVDSSLVKRTDIKSDFPVEEEQEAKPEPVKQKPTAQVKQPKVVYPPAPTQQQPKPVSQRPKNMLELFKAIPKGEAPKDDAWKN